MINTPIQGLDEEKYRGRWLVIDGQTGKILLVGDDLAEVQKKAQAESIARPVYYKVPVTDTHYVAVV